MKAFLNLKTAQVAALALSTIALAALAAGCSTKSHARATPVFTSTEYSAAGGAGSATEMETGGAAQAQPAAPAPAAPAQPAAQAQPSGSPNVTIPLYREEVRVGTRQVPAGTVTLHKGVKTEEFNQPIQLRQETLTVNRQDGGATGTNAQNTLTPTGRTDAQNLQAAGEPGKTFQEQDTVIQLYREEPVIQKQIVPSGQITAQKQAQSQQMNIQEKVRREEVQVSKSDDAKNVNISPNVQSTEQSQDKSTATGAPPSGQEESSGKGTGGKTTDQQ